MELRNKNLRFNLIQKGRPYCDFLVVRLGDYITRIGIEKASEKSFLTLFGL